MEQKTTHAYDDIIHLPHHVSPKRPGMSMTDRAAQFSPFAALTGYESVIQESGRLTDTAVELTDSGLQQINFSTSVSPIFFAAGPGIKQGFETDRVIREVDLAPTISASSLCL